MAKQRKPYPSDVSDDEWSFCAPYLTLMNEQAPQRVHPLREIFNALRYLVKMGGVWRMMPHDLPPWQMVYQQTQRWIKAGCFEAMAHDLRVVLRQVAFVDQGYTGDVPALAAAEHGIELEVVKHYQAKRGFVLLPRRWVVERSFAWAARFRRLARDYERLAATLAGYHWLAFVTLMLNFIYPKS